LAQQQSLREIEHLAEVATFLNFDFFSTQILLQNHFRFYVFNPYTP